MVSLDISIYIRLARSNLLRALPRKPVTIFGQLDPARLPKKPPGDARAPPRPPDEVAGYPAVPPPPLFGRLPQIDACRSHVCVVFTHLPISRSKWAKNFMENVTPYMTYKGWGRYETRWKTGFHPRRNFQSCDAASRWIYGGDEKGKNKAAA